MLTPKREHFCQEMLKPKATQSEAYRVAFKTTVCVKVETIHSEAPKLMQDPQITVRMAGLRAPVVEKAQLALEQWVEDGLTLYRADPRKLFDRFGNSVPITELGDDEITLIEGFKFTEEYTKVRKTDGETDATPAGYTQAYKLTAFKTRREYMGKVLKAVKGTAWKQPIQFVDDPAQAHREMEQAFARGDLNTDELTVLLRFRDLQLKVAEHEALKSRLSTLEAKLAQLFTQRKEPRP